MQQQQQMSQDEMNQLQSLLAGAVTPPAIADNAAEKEEKPLNQPEATPEGVIELAKSVVRQNGELQNLVKQMSDQTAADTPSAYPTAGFAVITDVPTATAVTLPLASTVATSSLPDTQDTPGLVASSGKVEKCKVSFSPFTSV